MNWFKIGHIYTFVVSRCERIDDIDHFILRHQGKETKPGWAALGWKFCVRVSDSQNLYPLETFIGKKLKCRVISHKRYGFPVLKQEVARYTGAAHKIKSLEGGVEPSRKNTDSLFKPKVLTIITVKGEIVEHVPSAGTLDESPDCSEEEEIIEPVSITEEPVPELFYDEEEEKKELTEDEIRFQSCLKEAEKGGSEAQYQLAWMYNNGKGVNKDVEQAYEWCKKSARGGFEKAIYLLYKLGEWFEGKSCFDEAFECYDIAAKQGFLEAQYKVAEFQVFGYGGCDKDLNDAVQFYLLRARQGDQMAQNKLWGILHNNNLTLYFDARVVDFLLGLCYENGWGVYGSDEEAKACYGKAIKGGDFGDGYGEALYRMGAIEERNRLFGMAKRYYKIAKNAGHPDAVEAIRRVRKKENEEWDKPKIKEIKEQIVKPGVEGEDVSLPELSAEEQYREGLLYLACKDAQVSDWRDACVKYLLAAADKGHVDAQYVLGTVYMDDGDIPLAMEYFGKAADLEHAEAQYNVGLYHELGLSGKVDLLKSFDYFKRAAEQGVVDACYKVGVYYMVGDGVDYDETEAFLWLKKAADAGHKDAAYRVGLSYLSGKGIGHDTASALPYLEVAATAGIPEAMYLTAWCYELEQEIPGSLAKASVWYEKAVLAGVCEAAEKLCSPRWIIRKIKFTG